MKHGYGISTSFTRGIAKSLVLEALKELSIDILEVKHPGTDLPGFTPEPEELRAELVGEGIRVRSVHTRGLAWNNADPDKAKRDESIKHAQAAFDFAVLLGAEVVVCHSNTPTLPFIEENFVLGSSLAKDSLSRIAEYAAKSGVRMAVENMPARGSFRPTRTIEHVLDIIDGMGEHVGVCLDAGHSNANGISPAKEARIAGAKLFAVHLQDTDGLGEDQHWVPGRGSTNWNELISTLDEIDYSGPRTLEVKTTLDGFMSDVAALKGFISSVCTDHDCISKG